MLQPTNSTGHRRIHSANAFQFSRHSPFKNIFGQEQKKELQFTNLNKINKSACSAESTVISCDEDYFALPFGTYGGVIILRHSNIPQDSKSRRAHANPPLLSDHTGFVHDHSFSPLKPSYNDSEFRLFSTCSADCTIKIWKIRQHPELAIHGYCENSTTDTITLKGHEKKVNTGDFHPNVNNIFVSSSTDNTLRIWDITSQKDLIVLKDDFDDLIQSWDWSATASILYTSSRDTIARVYDPRTKYAIVSGKAHDGKKGFRVVCTNPDQFFTVGFNLSGTREYALWDLRKGMRKGPLVRETISDQTPTQLFPFYDSSSHLLYLAGKGDTKVRMFEIDSNSEPYVHPLGEFKLTSTNTGIAMLPKRVCDTKVFEVARFMKLNVESVETFNFHVPRKKEQQDVFSDDLYPPVPSGKPSPLTSMDWFSGKSCLCDLMSMRENYGSSSGSSSSGRATSSTGSSTSSTNNTTSVKTSRGRSYALKSAPSVDVGLNTYAGSSSSLGGNLDEFSEDLTLLINSYGFYFHSYLHVWFHKEMRWRKLFCALHRSKTHPEWNSVLIYGENAQQVKSIRDEIAKKDHQENFNRNEFISLYSKSKTSGVIFMAQLFYVHKAYQLGDEHFSDHETMEILYYDLISNEIVSLFLASSTSGIGGGGSTNTRHSVGTSGDLGGDSELIKTWADTLKKLCHRDLVRNRRIFKGFVLQLKDSSDSSGKLNTKQQNSVDVDIPAYWAKRWCVITEEFLFLYSHRKSPLPESAFTLIPKKKISLPGVTNMDFALPQYHRFESIDSLAENEWSNSNNNNKSTSSNSNSSSNSSNIAINLCFTLKFERNPTSTNKSNPSLIYFLANNEQQKESLFETIQINSGLIKVGSSEEERLLEKLGLPIETHSDSDMGISSATTPSDSKSTNASTMMTEEGIGKIQVWPISSDSISKEDLEDLFGVFGAIDQIELFSKEHRAVVTFHKKSSAMNALVLNHTNLDATKINVQALSEEQLYEPGYLKVENISPQCSKQDIRVIFATFGEIQKIKLWRDPNAKNHSFCGIIKFKTVEQAKMGLVFHGSKLYYEEIKVTFLESGDSTLNSNNSTSGNNSNSNNSNTTSNDHSLFLLGEDKLFNNEYDPNEVKANRQKVLIQIKGDKKIRSRQVELSPKSINSGDVFILDCGSLIYVWNGKHTSRFKKARGLDVATNLKLKERGGNAKIIIIDEGPSTSTTTTATATTSTTTTIREDEREMERQFWNALFSEYRDPSFVREEFLNHIPSTGGDDKEFEEKMDKNTILYRINFTEHLFDFSEGGSNSTGGGHGNNSNNSNSSNTRTSGKYQLKIVHRHSQPALSDLKSQFVYVLDCLSEIYIWEGKYSSKQQRLFGRTFASKIEQQDHRPIWTRVCKIVEHSEPILFKEKMSDYAGVLPIAVSQAAIDEKQGKEVFIWKVEGFEKVDYNDDYYGQLFSGDSFVILFKYYKSNKAKHLIYFWQGRDCSVNEKGASALLTIDVSNINLQGDDAPQIRMIQQKETRHFLSMFQSYLGLDGLVIPLGKFNSSGDSSSSGIGSSSSGSEMGGSAMKKPQFSKSTIGSHTSSSSGHLATTEESSKRVFQQALSQLYIYDIRCVKSLIAKSDDRSESFCEKTRAVQVDTSEFKSIEQISRLFNSNHTLLIVTKDKKEGYLWKGKYHHQEKELALARHVSNHVLKFPDSKLIQMDQNAEKDSLWKLFGLNAMNATPIKKVIKSQLDLQKKRTDPILYQFSGATGVVDVERVYNFSQDDLDIFNVFLLDAQELGCFLWFGSNSSHNLQKVALETSLRYCMTHYATVNNTKNQEDYTDVNLFVTYTGQEPATFKTHFHAWGTYRDKYIVNHLNSNTSNLSKEVLIPASDLMKEYARKTYSYKTLLSEQLPPGVDATKLEEYLSNEEFQLVFSMTRDEFNQLPKWKQESEKRKVYLF
ncbi:hypothetical protein C9374_008911 [Naegleria lovaniensis]|uniref:HP domain-containing protein n=1 Tax=Naegleria lovaniensis TaxID=51637 RepID=A0AA88GJY7_NAELO|nr:uncharacterized protein C9374_008911 [Naegleria lovaniensis]KAG2377826.1 hypothetical protein C9374_008911 [Naegleria lovaniensis]